MSDTLPELHEYLKAKNLNAIFVAIVEAILIDKPENPIGFILNFLLDKYPEETKEFNRQHETKKKDTLFIVPNELNSEESTDDSSMNTEATDREKSDENRLPQGRKKRQSVCAERLNTEDDQFDFREIKKTENDAARIVQILKQNVFFQHCDETQIETIQRSMFLVEKQDGETIIKQGDDGDNFYIIDSGFVDVYINSGISEGPRHVKRYAVGDAFGELAIMYNSPRAATCIAKGYVRLWALDRLSFKLILMKTTSAKREALKGFLTKVQVFSELTEYEILTIADALVEENFEDNAIICKQGEIGEKFYLVKDGTAVCTKMDGKGFNVKVATLSSGSYFGEIALLSSKTRQATVTSEGPLKCLSLDRRTFNRVMGPLQDILMRNLDVYNKFQASNI